MIQQYEAGFPNMQQVITQEVTTPDNMDDTTKDSDDYWSNYNTCNLIYNIFSLCWLDISIN